MRAVWVTLGLAFAAYGDTYYVQANRAELRKEPKMSAAVLANISRGESVSLVGKKEMWFEVKAGAAQGWVPRLFLSQHPPVGATELSNLPSSTTLERASRRRPSSFSVSASTRGLMLSERARRGQEKYEADFEALTRLEEKEILPAQMEAFRTSARLTE